jgi:hypothetical protein
MKKRGKKPDETPGQEGVKISPERKAKAKIGISLSPEGELWAELIHICGGFGRNEKDE